MIIILPFVLAFVSCVYALRGRRGAALAWWTATLIGSVRARCAT